MTERIPILSAKVRTFLPIPVHAAMENLHNCNSMGYTKPFDNPNSKDDKNKDKYSFIDKRNLY
jgi:hypothetical protein